ncbi:hypothetical protein [Tateyamaria sp.]|uniref:hypothetical protein n=1 Tax=Tateyamaria sp. TaxID=1929288 RepID=UPI00329CD0B0
MYKQDSFFDLTPWGQVGLVAISTTLCLLLLLVAWAILRSHGPVIRIGGALVLFWLFVWLSPQIYYMYYWTIIPDLPVQWVIWPPPGLGKPFNMLIFNYRPNLSAHSQGILGWCTLAAPIAHELWNRVKRTNR